MFCGEICNRRRDFTILISAPSQIFNRRKLCKLYALEVSRKELFNSECVFMIFSRKVISSVTHRPHLAVSWRYRLIH